MRTPSRDTAGINEEWFKWHIVHIIEVVILIIIAFAVHGQLREQRAQQQHDSEAVSKILAQQDDEAGKLHEAEIVGGMIFIADDQPPEVTQPGEEPLDLPPPLAPAERAAILGGRFLAVAAVRSNHGDA